MDLLGLRKMVLEKMRQTAKDEDINELRKLYAPKMGQEEGSLKIEIEGNPQNEEDIEELLKKLME